jgi:Nineteen complex-related protein 2
MKISVRLEVYFHLPRTESLSQDSTAAFIPSESSIKVAKEKRERLRKTQIPGEEDFISLSVTKRADEPQGPHPESRLVREEDELGEGDDGRPLSACSFFIYLKSFLQNLLNTLVLRNE